LREKLAEVKSQAKIERRHLEREIEWFKDEPEKMRKAQSPTGRSGAAREDKE